MEFSEDELSRVKEALAENQTYGIVENIDLEDYRIARTHETTEDFKSNGKWDDILRGVENGDGWVNDLIMGYQYQKGQPRENLLIIDLGDVRAVVEV